MDRFAHYGWPFFEPKHAPLAREAEAWAKDNLGHAHGDNADAICKRLVQDLGCAGYLNHCVSEKPDVRSIAILREVLAYHAGLADFAFVMQSACATASASIASSTLIAHSMCSMRLVMAWAKCGPSAKPRAHLRASTASSSLFTR